jgi:hypothetical protein
MFRDNRSSSTVQVGLLSCYRATVMHVFGLMILFVEFFLFQWVVLLDMFALLNQMHPAWRSKVFVLAVPS